MPQPGGSANPTFLPYPTTSGAGNFPPYPPSSFGNFPSYPPANTNAPTSYPYMPNPSGYSFYGVSSTISIFVQQKQNPATKHYQYKMLIYFQQSNTSQDGTMTITEEHIKASLISAVEDKLRRRIQERVNQYQAEMDTLNRTKHELNEGKAKINDIILKLEREEVCLKYQLRCVLLMLVIYQNKILFRMI